MAKEIIIKCDRLGEVIPTGGDYYILTNAPQSAQEFVFCASCWKAFETFMNPAPAVSQGQVAAAPAAPVENVPPVQQPVQPATPQVNTTVPPVNQPEVPQQ